MKKPLFLSWIEFLPAIIILPIILVLPRRLGLLLAKTGGLISWVLVANYRKVARINLELAFNGDLDETQCKTLVRRSYINFAITAYELILASRLSRKKILQLTNCPDKDSFSNTIKDGKGVIVCSAHYSNWYWPALFCAAHEVKVNVVVRPLDNPLLDRQMHRALTRLGISVIPRQLAMQECTKALRRGEVVALMIDQNAAVGGIFVPFFGIPASTMRGQYALRQATDCHLICVHHKRRGYEHEVHMTPPMLLPEDEHSSLLKVNQYFEKVIRNDPGPYLWLHPRWKKQPPGFATYYAGLKV